MGFEGELAKIWTSLNDGSSGYLQIYMRTEEEAGVVCFVYAQADHVLLKRLFGRIQYGFSESVRPPLLAQVPKL